MATAIVSGRIDVRTRDRAGAFIRRAGTTPGEVIRIVWENIAATGQIPEEVSEVQDAAACESLQEFFDFCDSLDWSDPEYEWVDEATDEQVKDFIAEGLAEKYA